MLPLKQVYGLYEPQGYGLYEPRLEGHPPPLARDSQRLTNIMQIGIFTSLKYLSFEL